MYLSMEYTYNLEKNKFLEILFELQNLSDWESSLVSAFNKKYLAHQSALLVYPF